MPWWPSVAADVVTWFHDLFAQANRHLSELLLNVPSLRETSLDDSQHRAAQSPFNRTFTRQDLHALLAKFDQTLHRLAA